MEEAYEAAIMAAGAKIEQMQARVSEAAATISDLRRRLEEAEKDARRMDWLEGEFAAEGAWLAGDRITPMPRSLFRGNLPITRAAIDAAMSEEKR